MKKYFYSFILIFIFLNITVYADDTYVLTYENSKCKLLKNGKETELFDKRFDRKQPRRLYTCSAIQKEQYNNCSVIEKENISAFYYGYGAYEYTNLIMSFQNPHKSVKSKLKVLCTKK